MSTFVIVFSGVRGGRHCHTDNGLTQLEKIGKSFKKGVAAKIEHF